MFRSPLVLRYASSGGKFGGSWQLQFLPPCLIARIRLHILKASLSVGKIVIFALVLREEAAEPLDGSFGIVSAGIKRGDPASIVVGVFQLIRGDCPVSARLAPCRVHRKQQSGLSPFSIGLPFRLGSRLGRLIPR